MNLYISCPHNKANKLGFIPVNIICVRDGRRIVFTSGLHTRTPFSGDSFPRSEANHRLKTQRLIEILDGLEELQLNNRMIGNERFKELAMREVFGKGAADKLLTELVSECAQDKNEGNKKIYVNLNVHINAYAPTTTLAEVDTIWLERFYQSLYSRNKNSVMSINGKAKVMRTLRAVINYCIRQDYTTDYPFKNYRIKEEETFPNNISVQQLRMLRDYPCEEWQKKHRDLWMLSFYLCGINACDLLLAKEIVNGRIQYKRQKTHKLISVPVPPEAMKIIRRYKGKNYLLDVMDNYSNYRDYMKRWREGVKKIGTTKIVKDKVGKMRKVIYQPLFPDITLYTARYTFASIAAELDIPKETIAMCLGHTWASSVTDRYIAINLKKIDVAVRKVIDYVNEKPPHE